MFKVELDASNEDEMTFMIKPIDDPENYVFLVLDKHEYESVIKLIDLVLGMQFGLLKNTQR